MTIKLPTRKAATEESANVLLGPHPRAFFSDYLRHQDGFTAGKTPHRAFEEADDAHKAIPRLRSLLTNHHASAEQIRRSDAAREAFARQGLALPTSLRRFPLNPDTRKGNFAEIILAEYIAATGPAKLPVYRLRHNTNVDQSMKGDDVLAFDLDAEPVRIIVGEAKFRKTSAAKAVDDIVGALKTSRAGGVPASLQFVADHVEDAALAERIMACARLFADRRIRVDYVGLLVSDKKAGERVAAHGDPDMRRLVLLSLGLAEGEELVDACFHGLV